MVGELGVLRGEAGDAVLDADEAAAPLEEEGDFADAAVAAAEEVSTAMVGFAAADTDSVGITTVTVVPSPKSNRSGW